jgi:tripartite-type tricarboxylate transporter receptor subunit TctC
MLWLGLQRHEHSTQAVVYLAAGTGLASLLPRAARTQSYPARPVHVIVPLSAGSAADILARRLAQKMSES